MSPVGFEPTISAGERPQTYALDRASTGTGAFKLTSQINFMLINCFVSLDGKTGLHSSSG